MGRPLGDGVSVHPTAENTHPPSIRIRAVSSTRRAGPLNMALASDSGSSARPAVARIAANAQAEASSESSGSIFEPSRSGTTPSRPSITSRALRSPALGSGVSRNSDATRSASRKTWPSARCADLIAASALGTGNASHRSTSTSTRSSFAKGHCDGRPNRFADEVSEENRLGALDEAVGGFPLHPQVSSGRLNKVVEFLVVGSGCASYMCEQRLADAVARS